MTDTLKVNEDLKLACQDMWDTYKKLDLEEFKDLESKLEFVIGSYEWDKNPIGLHEVGAYALDKLKAYKKEKPRKVNKKIIDKSGKAILAYEELNVATA